MATHEAGRGRLVEFYRRHVGEPNREVDVYAGFGLFFGGIALGVTGLAVFLWSTRVPGGEPFFWQLRELAIGLAFVGLPAFVLSVVVLLPVGRRTVFAGIGGTAVCLVAVALFVAVYPQHWNVQGAADFSARGIALYAAGLAVLVASTGAALVAHHLDRAHETPTHAGEAPAGGPPAAGGAPEEQFSEERIRRDIEEATDAVELTWGGVERTDTTRRLEIRTDEAIEAVDSSGFTAAAAKTTRSTGVDDAVTGLRQLQGGDRQVGTGAGVDEQTTALRQLRDRQAAQEPTQPETVLGRVRDRLGLE